MVGTDQEFDEAVSALVLKKQIAALPLRSQTNLFQEAARENNIPAMRAIVAAVPPDVAANAATGALWGPVTDGDVNLAKELLKVPGINVNGGSYGPNGFNRSLLGQAILCKRVEMVRLLLSREELDINALVANVDLSALAVYAAERREKRIDTRSDMERCLSDLRSETDMAAAAHITAVVMAETWGKDEILSLLLADPRFNKEAHEAHLAAIESIRQQASKEGHAIKSSWEQRAHTELLESKAVEVLEAPVRSALRDMKPKVNTQEAV